MGEKQEGYNLNPKVSSFSIAAAEAMKRRCRFMASSSNHQPSLKKIANAGNGEDRISTLPDSVLAHILSFLPTKYAVATSTLSPRWKHIWTCVPNLEFDEKTLLIEHPRSGIHKPKDHHRHALSFANDKNWPVFPNLTQLELGVCHNFCCESLFDLLNGAPNLCTMVFAKVPLHDGFAYSKQFNWFEPQEVPSCLRSSLKEIKISGIDASQDELNLIKYLLKNAEVLTKMTIRNVISSMEGENELLKELVMAPRCSNTCQIERV